MKMTLRDRVIRFLTETNHKELPTRSRKYRKFAGGTPNTYYFIGKSGAVRAGASISSSVSLTNQFHELVRHWEKREGYIK